MAQPLLKVNGTPLWDGGRTYEMNYEHAAELRTALDGTAHVDYGGVKLSLSLKWSHLPSALSGYLGRDDLYALARQPQTLTVSIGDVNGDYIDYQMIIRPGSYQETLVFRVGTLWVYTVSLHLVEV